VRYGGVYSVQFTYKGSEALRKQLFQIALQIYDADDADIDMDIVDVKAERDAQQADSMHCAAATT
jgi:hypothetical protein